MHILLTVLHTVGVELVRRICLKYQGILSSASFNTVECNTVFVQIFDGNYTLNKIIQPHLTCQIHVEWHQIEMCNFYLSPVSSLHFVNLSFQGAGREGLYVQTEFIAVVAALLIWWSANNVKSKLQES